MAENKKQALYNSVIELVAQGRCQASVAEIATTAGVGKGTVYEYCTCKEELFADAIIDFITHKMDYFSKATESGSFEQRLKTLITETQTALRENKSMFDYIMLNHQVFSLRGDNAQKCIAKCEEIRITLYEILNDIINQGVKEGIIEEVKSVGAIYYPYISVIASTNSEIMLIDDKHESIFTTDFCYDMFIKMLK